MTALLSINNYHYYRGGAETVFLEHNRMFAELGWQVVPFAMKHPKNLPSPWSEHFVDEIEFGSSYSLREKLVRVPKVIYSFEARRKLARLLDEVQPAIAHAHNIYHHISPSILGLLRKRGVPVVLTLHDLKIACPAYNMLTHDGICERCRGGRVHNVVVHRCIKGSLGLSSIAMAETVLHRMLGSYDRDVNCFVVPSRFYIDKLVQWGWKRDRFRHVPNFVDPARFTPAPTPGRHFLYIGRLSHEKGLATLVKAAALADVPVAFAGTGPQAEELQELASQLGAEATFHGYLQAGQLTSAIQAARAVVLPSEWYENAPMSVLEAYALGKPVIGARIGGIPELIKEEETGLGFASGDVEALANALRRAADLPDARLAELGRAGRRWVEEEFTAVQYRRRMISIYEELGVRQSQVDCPATG